MHFNQFRRKILKMNLIKIGFGGSKSKAFNFKKKNS